jgi:DNA-directed RNA polymerase subunit L
VRSGGGRAGARADFDERFRLVSLSPGKTIQINNIRVVSGRGFENAKFNTCAFEYDTLDHIEVHYLSEKEQILSHMTAVSDIIAEMKRLKQARAGTPGMPLYGQRIIAIPNTDILRACPESVRDRVKNRFDIILENTKLQPISSSLAKPRHFYLAFKFFAEVDPLAVMQRTMQSLKDRLLAIKAYIDAYITDADAAPVGSSVEITVSGSIAEILVRGEDHVIGNLIVKTILELDPNVAGALYKIIHPSNRSVVLKVMHSQPLKIVTDAITRCHDDFDNLQRQFTKK